MVDALKYPVSYEERHRACQDEMNGPLQKILDRATTNGSGRLETISAMAEVLKNLRLAYAEDPDPAGHPPDRGDAYDFATFPSADRLVRAFVDERDRP